MVTYNTTNFFSNNLPLTLFAQATVNGTSAAEVINGSASRDAIYGNGGADTIYGGAGDDTYIVQNQNVTMVEAATGGVDTIKSTTNLVLPTNIENLIILGTTGYSGTTGIGNDQANFIAGDINNQFIEGGKGNDVLVGGGGSDIFIFGAGSGLDAINDFQTGPTILGGDVIRLRNYSVTSFADFQAHLIQQGADTLLTLSGTDKVLIRNTLASSFTSDNFQAPVDLTNFHLTFDEEFNSPISWYNSSTKTGTWLPEFGYGGIGSKASHDIAPYTGEEQIYVDPSYAGNGQTALGLNPFNLANGVMEINSGLVPAADSSALWNFQYYAGMLSSVESFSQTYGYFEMRAKLPSESGAWPAFWLHPLSGNPPEIDILEQHGSEPNVAHASLHDVSLAGGKIGNTIYVPDATTAFHTYGLLWTADTLTWYIDGAQVYQLPTPADLNQPAYLVLNLPIGSVGGTIDPNNLPSGYQIDYVHAYAAGQPAVPVQNLLGTGGIDSLVGGAGADTLDGGLCADVLTGGAGNDTYYVDNAKDVVTEAVGGGTDTVYSSTSWVATAGSEIEKLVASGTANINLTGNGTAMQIQGNAGINTLDDGGAADTLIGGAGNDSYVVHNAAALVVEDAGAGYDTVKTTVSAYHLTDNVEVLTFIGTGDFIGTGNAMNNVITGGAGNDTLDGGGGADRMTGGAGNDSYYVNNSGDSVVEAAGGGTDTVFTTVSNYRAPANVEAVSFIGAGNFIGYASAGVKLSGGVGNDSLYGATSGADTLYGGNGSDILSGGAASDTFVLNDPSKGVDRIINFHSVEDHIMLPGQAYGITSMSQVAFVNGSASTTSQPSLVYDPTGKLYWDAGNHNQILIATFDAHPTLHASDFIIG
jgi:Ca2+-binding RTX toxin-like protein